MKKAFIPHLHLDLRRMRPSLSGVWIIGVIVALISTLAVALFAVILFLDVFKADAVPTDAPSGVTSISRDNLAESVRIIDARMSAFERLTTAPPVLPDPSH